MVLFAISAFGCTVPHYLFGQQLMNANKAFYGDNNQMELINPSASINNTIQSGLLSSHRTNDSIDHLNLCRSKNEAYNNSISDKGIKLLF